MLIGSNNSLTYLRPSLWWSKIFGFLKKCQSVTYVEQYEYCSVRLFDLKLYTDKNHHMVAKNGNVKYPIFSLYEILNYFDKKGDVTIRVTLGTTLDDLTNDVELEKIEEKFATACNMFETVYPNIKYFGGKREYDKKPLYKFNYEKENGIPNIIDIANSSWLYRTFPILSCIKNRSNILKYKNEDGFLLLNFVDRRYF